MKKIKANKIRCKKCNEIIESTHRHNFKYCYCGAVAVDGGKDYLRRCGNREDWEELSEFEEERMGRKDTDMIECDFMEFAEIVEGGCDDHAWEIIQSNPEQKKLFSMERICQQIEEELDAEKVYMIMKEYNSDEADVLETFVLISNAIGLAVATNNAALIKRLIEVGMHIELETIIVIECYENDMIMRHHEVTLMEVLANFNEMENEDYAFCWQNARETSCWPLKEPLELRLPASEKIDNDVLVHNVRRLEQHWEEAANVLLMAFVKDYFMRIDELPEGTWEDLCFKLADKTQFLFETLFCEMLEVGLTYHTSIYSRAREKLVSLLWKFVRKNTDEEAFKNNVVSMMDTLLEDYD